MTVTAAPRKSVRSLSGSSFRSLVRSSGSVGLGRLDGQVGQLTTPEVSGNGYHCSKSPTGAHYWDIESPNGNMLVKGRCRYCPEAREFPAVFDEGEIDYCAELGRLLI